MNKLKYTNEICSIESLPNDLRKTIFYLRVTTDSIQRGTRAIAFFDDGNSSTRNALGSLSCAMKSLINNLQMHFDLEMLAFNSTLHVRVSLRRLEPIHSRFKHSMMYSN